MGGVTATDDGSSSSAARTGEMWTALPEACPQAECTSLTLEFGTVSAPEVLQALRADHWLPRHPDAPPALARQIRQQMRAAFYPETDAWKTQVAQQTLAALRQAAAGLAAVTIA